MILPHIFFEPSAPDRGANERGDTDVPEALKKIGELDIGEKGKLEKEEMDKLIAALEERQKSIQEAEGDVDWTDDASTEEERQLTETLLELRDAVAMYGRAHNQLDGDTSKALEYANGLLEGLKDRVKQSEDSLAGRSSRVAQGAGIDLAKHESQFGYEFDAEGNITNVGEAAANIRYMQELINQKNGLSGHDELKTDGILGEATLSQLTSLDEGGMEELFGVKSMQDVTPEVIRSSYQKWYESRAQASQESSAGESASEDAVSRFSQGGGESMSDLDKIAARRREKNEKEAVDAQEQEEERISFISSSKELFDEYEIDDNDVADLEAFHHDVGEMREQELPGNRRKLADDMSRLSADAFQKAVGEDVADADATSTFVRQKLLQDRAEQWQEKLSNLSGYQQYALERLSSGDELTHEQMDDLTALLNENNQTVTEQNKELFGRVFEGSAADYMAVQSDEWYDRWTSPRDARRERNVLQYFAEESDTKTLNPSEMFGIGPDEEYRRNGDFVVEGDSKDINDLRVARVPELDDEGQVKKPGRLQPLSEYAQRMYESDGHNDREVAGYRLEWHDDDTLHLVSPRNAVYTYNPDANGGGDFEQVNSEV